MVKAQRAAGFRKSERGKPFARFRVATLSVMISSEEFVERLCRLCADRGPRRFPRKPRDREILMKSIVMLMDSDRTYSENEVNVEIQVWNQTVAPAIDCDHVSVRRLLIDYGHLERTADGQQYRIGFPPQPLAFDLEVDHIDVKATIAAYVDYEERRRLRRGKPETT